MRKYIKIFCLFAYTTIYSQCAIDVETGVNLIKNSDFSLGYQQWNHDAPYAEFVPCGGCSSKPGYVYAATDPSLQEQEEMIRHEPFL